jgi:succinoglycan biosynthesis protein ExoA
MDTVPARNPMRGTLVDTPARPFVTILAPVLNEERYLAHFIESVLRCDYPKDRLELCLVDGCSQDRTREVIEQYAREHSWIRRFDNPKQTTASSLNLGLPQVRGEIVVRMDAHSLYPPDYVSLCVQKLLTSGAQNVGGRMEPMGVDYWTWCIAYATSNPFGVGDAKYRYSRIEQLVDTVYLGAWRTETLRGLGGFSEDVGVNEDYELNVRLRKTGGQVLYCPGITAQYHVRSSLGSLIRQYWKYGFSRVLTLRRHPNSLRWRQVAPPGVLLGLLASALVGLWSPGWGLILPAFYATCSLGSSMLIAARQGWRYFPGLPVVFGVIHFSWGAGFLAGLLNLLRPLRAPNLTPDGTEVTGRKGGGT